MVPLVPLWVLANTVPAWLTFFPSTTISPAPRSALETFRVPVFTTSAPPPKVKLPSSCTTALVACCKSPRLTAWENISWLRSEEHTSELQSRGHLVCRLLLQKNKHIQEGEC